MGCLDSFRWRWRLCIGCTGLFICCRSDVRSQVAVVWLYNCRAECRWTIDHIHSDVMTLHVDDLIRTLPSILLAPYHHLTLQR
ncbi:hypothetical protein M011DRAFT_406851 [Sporormia fimetaria CBS 119925]|uniref:Secreted protein n=1 Tax=Sporormia fimetaria CBS 119925 TaxID=1340428 RepID=A0A6A6V5P8_9PLEO|nr:hypothetical protein M011DRAFT_406851 [Sporormia fimetaria CBS 119925]